MRRLEEPIKMQLTIKAHDEPLYHHEVVHVKTWLEAVQKGIELALEHSDATTGYNLHEVKVLS
jgi:hypothetical protein